MKGQILSQPFKIDSPLDFRDSLRQPQVFTAPDLQGQELCLSLGNETVLGMENRVHFPRPLNTMKQPGYWKIFLCHFLP